MLQQNLGWPVNKSELCLSSSAGCSLSASERGAVQDVCEQRLELRELQGLFDCGCLWKSCAIAHEDSVCAHVLLQSLWSEFGCLGHWAAQMFCTVILQKKRVKKAVFVCKVWPGWYLFLLWLCCFCSVLPMSAEYNRDCPLIAC